MLSARVAKLGGNQLDRPGGLAALVHWQAESLARLSARTGDRSLLQQAEVLDALVGAKFE